MDTFASVLNCIDGRFQRKAFDYFAATFGVRSVDTVTVPGMVKHIAHTTDRTAQILDDVGISITKHGSTQLGIVAHADCAGNPVGDDTQKGQVRRAIEVLRTELPDTEVIGVWLGIDGIAERIDA